MGSTEFYPEESPVHRVGVDGFWMDEHPVTVAEFRRFVKATGRATTAEVPPDPTDYPGATPEELVPGSLVFRADPGGGAARRLPTLVVLDPGSRLAPSGGPWEHRRWPRATPRHPRVVLRRQRLRSVVRQGPAHRGRVGVRRPRRSGPQALRLGRRGAGPGSTPGQHLAGTLSLGEPARRRLPRHVAGRQLPRQPVRTLRHHRKRLGVDDGLLLPRPHGGREEHLALGQLLRAAQPAGGPRARHRPARERIHAEWSRAGPTCVPPTTVCATGRRPGRVRRRRRRRPTSAFAASSDPCPDR